jgi:myo-inositol-1(or 4)-monophosphatase
MSAAAEVMTGVPAGVEMAARYASAQRVIREAGRLAMEMFRRREELVIEEKGVQDMVSIADRMVEDHIRGHIVDVYPLDAVVGEERGGSADAARFVWVIDPIDGTACFVNGMHAWCISIGIMLDGEPVIGVVFDPNADELFHACAGQGAWLHHTRLQVNHTPSLTGGVLGVGFSHRVGTATFLPFLAHVLSNGGMFIRNGSGALMIAYVAAGRLIGYFEPHINSWDCLAGIVLVREAGGVCNDFLDNDGLQKGNPILAAGPALYDVLAPLSLPFCRRA